MLEEVRLSWMFACLLWCCDSNFRPLPALLLSCSDCGDSKHAPPWLLFLNNQRCILQHSPAKVTQRRRLFPQNTRCMFVVVCCVGEDCQETVPALTSYISRLLIGHQTSHNHRGTRDKRQSKLIYLTAVKYSGLGNIGAWCD